MVEYAEQAFVEHGMDLQHGADLLIGRFWQQDQRIYFLVNTSGEEISAGAAQSVGRGLELT